MNTFEIMKWIGDAPSELLNAFETALLMRMALFGDSSGKNINPGVEWLVMKTKISDKAVRTTLQSLIRKGVITCSSIRKHGTSDKSSYEINITFLKEVCLGKVPVTGTGTVPVAPTGTFERTKIKSTGKSGIKVPVAPTGTPYIQYNDYSLLSNVELDANSTSSFPPKKIRVKKDISKTSNSEKVKEVFDHWQKVLNHPMSKLDSARKTKILNALKLGFSVEELKKAIDGVKKTPWNMGSNPSGKPYHEIGLIFRNRGQIERFLDNFDIPPRVEEEKRTTAKKSGFLENDRKLREKFDALEEKYCPKADFKFPEWLKFSDDEENESEK